MSEGKSRSEIKREYEWSGNSNPNGGMRTGVIHASHIYLELFSGYYRTVTISLFGVLEEHYITERCYFDTERYYSKIMENANKIELHEKSLLNQWELHAMRWA
jgi:hypothetical protein